MFGMEPVSLCNRAPRATVWKDNLQIADSEMAKRVSLIILPVGMPQRNRAVDTRQVEVG